MLRIYLCLFISVVFINLFSLGYADIPSNRLCADPKCSEAISDAQGSVRYFAKDINELSFKPGDKLTIISKSEEKDGYWGAKLGNKVGYVSKKLIKETKVHYPTDQLKYVVPVEPSNGSDEKSNVNVNDAKLDPNNSTVEISSSVPEINEVKTSVDTSSFASLSGVSAEEVNETLPNYTEIDGTKIYYEWEKKEVTPSPTIQADTNTIAVESTTPNPIPETVTETSNENLKAEEKVTEETKLEKEDDEDDVYDDGDDEDDDDEGLDEEEEESASQESTENPVASNVISSTVKNEEAKDGGAVPVVNTEKPIPEPEVKDFDFEKSSAEIKTSGETGDSVGSGWSILNNVANLVLSSGSSEDKSETSSETESSPDNLTVSNVLVEEIVENVNKGIKENKPDVSEKIEEIKMAEDSAVTIAPPVDENQNVAPDLPKEEFVTSKKEEGSGEVIVNTTEIHNDFGSSLNENTKNVEATPPDNDLVNLVKEEIPSELPPIPNLVPNSDNTQNDPLIGKEETVTTESYQEKDSISKEPASTTESSADFLSPSLPPVLQYESIRSDNIISNFVPMTEASKVEEVTTETYQPKEIAFEPPTTEFLNPTSENKIIPDLPSEPNLEIPAAVEDVTEAVTEEQPGYFSTLLDTAYDYLGLKQKEENPDEVVQEVFVDAATVKESDLQQPDDNKVEAIPEGNCKSVFGLESNCEDAPLASHNIWDSWYSSGKNMDANATFYTTLLYLIITAVTVLLFTLGYYFIEENRKCSPLIAKVNNLEQQLMVSSAECVLLKEELQNAKDKIVLYEDSSNNELVISLQNELKEAQKIKSELEATIESLQQELDAATEAGLDLNRMLSEVLTQKGGSDSLMESVERLQAQLDSQQKIIDDMNTSLVMKNQENEGLQVELASANDKIENLEEELNDIKQNLHMLLKEKEDVTSELTARNNQLQNRISQLSESKEKEILGLKRNNEDLSNKLSSLSETLAVREGELNALKESVKVMKTESGRSVDELFDVTRVKAELNKAQKEKAKLQDKLQAEEEARKLLEDRIKSAESEVQKLRENYTEAEKEKIEAQTKLEVLSKYFKEKEMQLQKELGLQEAMWLQKQGDDTTVYERMTSLQEEVENYKSQNEMLKKEILDQERGLKSQIATLEKKAHENWVAARQAERKLEESKQEAAQLRNRLTMMEKNINNDLEAKQNHRLTEEINGGETFSPLLHDTSSPMPFPPLPLDPSNPALLPPGFIPPPMFIPPPGGFMPPPPPFLPGDRRPPPLGRMSSPPLNNRFSPSPDYSMERMSPPPLSPPVRNYKSPNEPERDRDRFRHRTPPFPSFPPRDWEDSHSSGHSGFRPISSQRDARRDNKGSTLSSGHSSSDSLDKSSRHSGRV